MTDTDMQVFDLLETTGEATAGELASLMALSTGTFTAILKRLEKAGLVRRERDPNDGRRVIVKLAQGADGAQEMGSLFAALGNDWEELANRYDDEHRAFLLEFLQRSNAIAREEILRLRAVSADSEGMFSAPLAGLERAQLLVSSDSFGLNLRAGNIADALYQAHFEGPVPDVKVKDGVVTIRYPRRLWIPSTEKRAAEVTLSTAIPWVVVIRSGGSEVTADLNELDLLEMEARGAGSMFNLDLPVPSGVVPIRLGGSGSQFSVRRPPGVAARVHMKGWGSGGIFDDQTIGGMSSDVRLQSPNYESAVRRYDLEVSGTGSMFTITAG
ncbi:MAG: MarR family transcriptional regulator [Anaerolineae bacterium]|nr:MarR family transcriptional regulator [Anaerolineae bacterium]